MRIQIVPHRQAEHLGEGRLSALNAVEVLASGIPRGVPIEGWLGRRAAPRPEIARPAFEVKDGYVALPTAPGLGIELDEAALGRHPVGEQPLRRIRQYSEETGALA